MSTVTAHTLLSQPVRYSAGGSSLRCPKPAVVSPYYAPAANKTPRSVCHAVDLRSIEHPSNISPIALVHPVTTKTESWKLTEEDNRVVLAFHHIPGGSANTNCDVIVDGDVLDINFNNKQAGGGDVSFHVRLLVPEVYDKSKIDATLYDKNLYVTIPKTISTSENLQISSPGKPFYKKVDVQSTRP